MAWMAVQSGSQACRTTAAAEPHIQQQQQQQQQEEQQQQDHDFIKEITFSRRAECIFFPLRGLTTDSILSPAQGPRRATKVTVAILFRTRITLP
jgi:hypothetical protein